MPSARSALLVLCEGHFKARIRAFSFSVGWRRGGTPPPLGRRGIVITEKVGHFLSALPGGDRKFCDVWVAALDSAVGQKPTRASSSLSCASVQSPSQWSSLRSTHRSAAWLDIGIGQPQRQIALIGHDLFERFAEVELEIVQSVAPMPHLAIRRKID
jgi:hypothetical protein